MSTKQKHTSKSRTVIILSVCVGILAAAIVVMGAITAHLLQRDHAQENQRLAHLILDAVDKMNYPLVRDASNKQYVPEARLVLPAPAKSLGEVVYSYTSGSPETLHLATKNSIAAAKYPLLNAQSQPDDIFAGVPKLQACARGVQITFSPINGQNAAATKTLANSRTAYFYTENLCLNTELLAYAQQIDSY